MLISELESRSIIFYLNIFVVYSDLRFPLLRLNCQKISLGFIFFLIIKSKNIKVIKPFMTKIS